ncbi:MAG: HD domain-containing protein [Prevotella sp.]|nr:HD domain-containing protein [Prevotella sp.]MBQ9561223.1 HD domain-containing protein [Prevotella sp.]MBR1840239.1 HD domain-containing protein [Prevotella sp.]
MKVSLDLMEFVERNILKRYNAFDAAHNIDHALRVIKASVELAEKMGADVDMAYVVAAYHDLGLEKERATHHIESGKILKADKRIGKWFTPQQIDTMRQAVEDHRASSSRVPRNIYGKIVAEADRDLNPETVFKRTVQYGMDHYPEMTEEEHWERFTEHMQKKYSSAGYIHLWIPGSQNELYLKELRRIIDNKTELRKHFDKIFSTLNSQQP